MKKMNLFELVGLSKIEESSKKKIDSAFEVFIDKNKKGKVEHLSFACQDQIKDGFKRLFTD